MPLFRKIAMWHKFSYLIVRTFAYFFSLFPLSFLHVFGKGVGTIAYYLLVSLRKRTLSNLSLAEGICLDEAQLIRTAKRSFQHLAITLLEYAKLSRIEEIGSLVRCYNVEEGERLVKRGVGVIFYCGHQSNWELLFLEGSRRMSGVAIGRPIANPYLYEWITSMRERFGGKVVTPREGYKMGYRALQQGEFIGIVGDQAMPKNGYAFDFLHRRIWVTPLPGILAYKTGSPIIVATIKREKRHYSIHYSRPIWPKLDAPMKGEIRRMMAQALSFLEKKVRETPDQWLWQHNCWKQDLPLNIRRPFYRDSILIILPRNPKACRFYLDHLSAFRTIYPRGFLTLFLPQGQKEKVPEGWGDLLFYSDPKELFLRDYRFKLIFNFSGYPSLKAHFLKLSAFKVVDQRDLYTLAKKQLAPGDDFSLVLKKALTHLF